MPTQMLAAVLCRGIQPGSDEGCPGSEDSLVKVWTLLLAQCVSNRDKQVMSWFPGDTKNALVLLLPSRGAGALAGTGCSMSWLYCLWPHSCLTFQAVGSSSSMKNTG